jgi:hypothetical protein
MFFYVTKGYLYLNKEILCRKELDKGKNIICCEALAFFWVEADVLAASVSSPQKS